MGLKCRDVLVNLRYPTRAPGSQRSSVGLGDRGTRATAAWGALAPASGPITCPAGADPRDSRRRRDVSGAWRPDRLVRRVAVGWVAPDRRGAAKPDRWTAADRSGGGRRSGHQPDHGGALTDRRGAADADFSARDGHANSGAHADPNASP